MNFQGLNRSDAEKAFITVRNITGAAISAGVPVEWDVVSVTDGNAVTLAKSGSLASLFAGVTDAAMADSAYGRIQVYGFRTSAYVSAASAGTNPGTLLVAAGGIFVDSTMSAATTSGWNFVTLMETSTASAAAGTNKNIFIRSL